MFDTERLKSQIEDINGDSDYKELDGTLRYALDEIERLQDREQQLKLDVDRNHNEAMTYKARIKELEDLNESLMENDNDLRSRCQKAEARIKDLETLLRKAYLCPSCGGWGKQEIKAISREKGELVSEMDCPLCQGNGYHPEYGRLVRDGKIGGGDNPMKDKIIQGLDLCRAEILRKIAESEKGLLTTERREALASASFWQRG